MPDFRPKLLITVPLPAQRRVHDQGWWYIEMEP